VARAHHDLALHHLRRGQVRLVVVGGGPGAGKTVLSERLAERLGASVISTDEVRKDLTGTARAAHRFAPLDRGVYDDATTDATYAEALRRAGSLLELGQSVVLDGSFSCARHRGGARSLARRSHADVAELECVVDTEVARARVARRLAGEPTPSDATPDLVDDLLARRDRWPEATPIDTSPAPEDVAEALVLWLGSGLR
jgi:predicted kinase